MSRTSIEEDQKALKRIRSMLLALANLAERASPRALPIRLLILWILRPAEAYARDLVMRAAHDLGYQVHMPPCDFEPFALIRRGTYTDTLRLALAFEMLAAVLEDLAALIQSQRRSIAPVDLDRFLARLQSGFMAAAPRSTPIRPHACAMPAYHDTS